MDQPKQEKRYHRLGVNPLFVRYVILQRQKGRPDCTEHNADGLCSIHSLNGEPEDGENSPRDDRNVGAPEAPRGASQDREWGMVDDAYGTV